MTQDGDGKPWDFKDALSLLNAVSLGKTEQYDPVQSSSIPISEPKAIQPLHNAGLENPGSQIGLGDFSSVWRFLNTSSSLPTQDLITSPTGLCVDAAKHTEYISDGAYTGSTSKSALKKRKSIQWRDNVNDGSLTDVAPDTSATEDDQPTKKPSSKKGKTGRGKATKLPQRDPESESELPRHNNTPARKASVHTLNVTPKASSAPAKSTRERGPDARKNMLQTYLREQYGYIPSGDLASPTPSRKAQDPVAVPASSKTVVEPEKVSKESAQALLPKTPSVTKTQWPISDPTGEAHQPGSRSVGVSSRQRHDIIVPKIVRSGEDRHWAFLLKLIDDFYPDRGSLIKPANLTTHSADPHGIHVFVDASNIFIGFHDQLKRARNIPVTARVPRVNMSFDSLALLMERRRPVAKRVLAGSTPHVAAFDVAKSIGYECSILDKVYKARELTERQRYFYEQDSHTKARRRSSAGHASSNHSGSDTNAPITAPTHAPSKMVEQGVDEILHLKILESLVDNDEPSTIVLATGDAAQAEYSQGFMVMVERALRKGWSVELVSWKTNISQMYRKAAFAHTWKDKFRIIELDEYAEELLDM